MLPSASLPVNRERVGEALPTDPRAQRNRAGRRGGHLLTRALSPPCNTGLPTLLHSRHPCPGRSHRMPDQLTPPGAKRPADRRRLRSSYRLPTRLSRPSPPSGTGPRSPRARARGRPGWRWRSSSSSQRKTAGAPSTHPTSWPWSALERPSPAASSSSGPHSSPSPKLPNDLDRQVLAIVPASSPSGPGTQTSAPYVQRLSGRPAARGALRRRLRDRPAGGAPPSRGTRALPSAPESRGGTTTLGMRPLLVARTSSAGSTAGSATMQVPTLAVSAEATTESGHPNLAGVECSG
jgi:hypothetical protein